MINTTSTIYSFINITSIYITNTTATFTYAYIASKYLMREKINLYLYNLVNTGIT